MNKQLALFSNVKTMLLRLGIVLVAMMLSRLLFLGLNYDHFVSLSFSDFLAATWFDCITIALYFLPFILISGISIGEKWFKIKAIILKSYFHSIAILMLALNLVDIEYFKYTGKRSTFDLFSLLGTGSDFKQLITTFITDFWVLILFLLLLSILLEWLYRKTQHPFQSTKKNAISFAFHLLIIVPIFIVIGRGGLQLRPVGIVEASQFTQPENSAFVLNTPFTMIKSYGKEHVEEKDYFTKNQLDRLFNPKQRTHPQYILPDKTNVMIILLESFGNEFVGAFNHGKTYTPFLDSLIGQSLTFQYGIANGKRSIEAVPSIIASIPSLMNEPYISSPYGNNTIEGLPALLKKNGYTSAFYHGATNGSMRFDGFAAQLGFDYYIGRTEYNNEKHADATWGILDEYFEPWTATQLTTLKQPFFATLFTLSSHHPYFVPNNRRAEVIKGPQPICASISYGDFSLRKFFEKAKKQPWYNNTLFILVADHTPATTSPLYSQRRMMYQIPIVFFHPKKLLPIKKEPILFQQLDIMPTVLDLLNIKTDYYSFGKSYYNTTENREAITYLEGSYFYFTNKHLYTFTNDRAKNMCDFTDRKLYTKDSLSFYAKEKHAAEQRIKAIIQRYNSDLIHNKTNVR
jgi:phosphoglycerol transferase MdoB-like AlkP superfamily enzyme